MTDLLEKAFKEASKLSPNEQDELATIILADIESERRWQEAFAESQDSLATLAKEALTHDEAGETEPLVPEEL